jgi:hypothetical protein
MNSDLFSEGGKRRVGRPRKVGRPSKKSIMRRQSKVNKRKSSKGRRVNKRKSSKGRRVNRRTQRKRVSYKGGNAYRPYAPIAHGDMSDIHPPMHTENKTLFFQLSEPVDRHEVQ